MEDIVSRTRFLNAMYSGSRSIILQIVNVSTEDRLLISGYEILSAASRVRGNIAPTKILKLAVRRKMPKRIFYSMEPPKVMLIRKLNKLLGKQ